VLFSIIIPTFNAEHTLGRAVESLLRQNRPELLELLIVDDGSQDATCELASHYGRAHSNIRFLQIASNGGPGIARNLGLQHARGEWICFLDADDEYSEYRLRYLSLIIEKYTKVNLILHSYSYKTESPNWSMPANFMNSLYQVEEEIQEFSEDRARKNTNLTVPIENTGNNRVHHGHITVKKKVFQETKFLIDQPGKEDGHFCNEVLSKYGHAKYFPIPLSIYNVERSATNEPPYKRLTTKFLKYFQK